MYFHFDEAQFIIFFLFISVPWVSHRRNLPNPRSMEFEAYLKSSRLFFSVNDK